MPKYFFTAYMETVCTYDTNIFSLLMMILFDTDVAYIATIHPSHVSLSLMMLAAGKHVLCEKPMSLTTAGAKKVLDFAKQKQLLFVEVTGADVLPYHLI